MKPNLPQTVNCQLQDRPYMCVAVLGDPQAGAPPLGPKTVAANAVRATPSRIASCWEPNLRQPADAHSPVVPAWQH